jgi:prolyl oligopeptidase
MRATPLVLLALAAPAAAQQPDDPYLWLEEVEGDSAMAWVEAQNAATVEALSAEAVYDSIYRSTLEVLNSEDRIAYPSILNGALYNFWQDEAHPRGLWRRTSWDSYLSGEPRWETVLDVDALAAKEGKPWVFHGADCIPGGTRCMVALSRGGADAEEVREFDLETRDFVPGGFFLPEAKSSTAWDGRDRLLVATDFGPGSLTTSGYPRVAKLWLRGTPLAQARTLLEGEEGDVGVNVGAFETADGAHPFVIRRPTFFESTTRLLRGDSTVALDLPADADPALLRDRLLVYLRSPWEVGGRTLPGNAVVAIGLAAFLSGGRDFEVVAAASERQTIEGIGTTRDYALVPMLDDVRGVLMRYRRVDGKWVGERVPAPDPGEVRLASTDPGTDRYFFAYESFLQPTTLYLSEPDGAVRAVAHLPARFDTTGLEVRQLEATSRDGTRVPYFVVGRRDLPMDGTNPTLLYGYGGFQISMTPGYSAVLGREWLRRGGVYALANIRGGGEFGPAWHRAALKEHRQRAYDDFIAVAEDLERRGITSPRHLGIEGGSNGGLLMGVMLTQRPDLFHAIAILNPLLDMKRYSHLLAGASWMGEYGDPDVPEQWAYISRYSPYQNLKRGQPYPRVYISTTTRDDRVHPGHARKMAAKMEAMGYPVLFYENTEGGHGAGVTNEQRARAQALVWTYLWGELE